MIDPKVTYLEFMAYLKTHTHHYMMWCEGMDEVVIKNTLQFKVWLLRRRIGDFIYEFKRVIKP